jgi:hypothetical protein
MKLVTPKAGAKDELLFNLQHKSDLGIQQTGHWKQFVKQKIKLCCIFKFDRIALHLKSDLTASLGVILLFCNLSPT